MATSAPPVTRNEPRFLRVWLPFVMVIVAILITAGVWAWPDGDLPDERRVFVTTIVILATITGLLGWVVVSSGWRWIWRLSVLAAFTIGLFGSLKGMPTFTGNMVPVFRFRWTVIHDEVVDAHRQKQLGAGANVSAFSPDAAPSYAEYRGPRRDGVIDGPALQRDWATHKPQTLWQQPVGGGYAGFAINGNLAVTIEQRFENEVIAAYDTESSRERWTYSYPAHFKETMGGPGPRATPTITGNRVYSLGATGELVCLDATTGAKQWQVNILERNANINWGMCGSPLVYDQVVVVTPGCHSLESEGRAVLAFDRDTGKPVWTAGSQRGSYASPMLATLAGLRQILIFDAAGLGGHDAQTGKELWRHPWVTSYEINAGQPVVLDGDRVFISSGYGHGCALIQVTQADGKWSTQELWQNRSMHCKFTSPVLHAGYLYGLDEGILVCLDAKTGKRQWKEGRYQHGQVLRTGDVLVIFSEDGKLVLVEASPKAHRELASMQVFEEAKNWNHLALAKGRVYLRNHKEMACVDLSVPPQ